MAVIESIYTYYSDRLKEYEGEIRKAIKAILGNEFVALYDTCKDTFTPVFMASKDGIEYYLGETITDEEREVLENLLEEMGENEQVVFLNETIREKFSKIFADFFRNSEKKIVQYKRGDSYNSWMIGKIDVISTKREGLFLDDSYIYMLICHLVENYFLKTKTKPNLSDSENKLHTLILKTVSLQILSFLRGENVFILDNDDEYKEELVNGKYILCNPQFIEKMSPHLFRSLLLRPNVLKKEIGEADFEKLVEAGLNVDDLEMELYEKLKSIPSVEFSYLFCKDIFSKDKFGLNDLKHLMDGFIIPKIKYISSNGVCATVRMKQLFERKEALIRNFDHNYSFNEVVEKTYGNLLAFCANNSKLRAIDSGYLTIFLYKFFNCCIDYINNEYHRKLDNHNIFILELHNFSSVDGKNYPNYVLLFDIDGEYYVCDGYSYLFAIMKYWENEFDINSEDLAKFRSDAAEYLMIPLSKYLERKEYYPVSGIPTIDVWNFPVVTHKDKSVVYIPDGLSDERMCDEVTSMSLEEFLVKKDVKSHN